jgi:3-mercaptopyruvate sulfurtransferase SseA
VSPRTTGILRGLPLAVLAAGVVLAGGCQRETRDTDIKLIRVAEVKSLMDRQSRSGGDLIALVDPRPAKYYAEAHIPGARNLTLPQVEPKAKVDPTLDRFGIVVVYGDNPASAEARGMTKRLMAVGYSGVRLYAGGMLEWNARGYPVEGHGVPAPAPATPVPSGTAPAPAVSPPQPPAPEAPPPPATTPGQR